MADRIVSVNDDYQLPQSVVAALIAQLPAPLGAEPAGAAATAITSHEATGNPHPSYLTAAEGNAAYDALGAAWAAQAAAQAVSLPLALAAVYVDAQTGATDRDKFIAALAAATASGGTVELPDRTVDVGAGLSLSGYSCGISGRGAGHDGTAPSRSVIRASTQTGPVLDFTGFLWPDSDRGRATFGNFAIQGSGVADATKNNAGIRVGTPAAPATAAYFHDIVTSETGGPGMDVTIYLSDFDRVTVVTPVGAKANDVPYWNIVGANGNRFRGIGFRSITGSNDVGVSGALVVKPGGGYAPEQNTFDATWFEYLHVPTNGCLISISGNNNVIDASQLFDSSKESGATGTAFARFLAATGTGVVDVGGNSWRGHVPGRQSGSPLSIDLGIDVQQSGNSIIGPKGYEGTNVRLAAGVNYTHVLLTGSEGAAGAVAFVNNSGTSNNILIDGPLGTEQVAAWARDNESAPAGPRFYNPAAEGNGAVLLGKTGVVVQGAGDTAYYNADAHVLRSISSDATKQFYIATSWQPGITFPDHGGLPDASAEARGKVCYVRGATGVADRLVVCWKDAAGSYAWVDLF